MKSPYVATLLLAAAFAVVDPAAAQDKGTVDPQPLPPLAKPDDPATPAKELFGRRKTPANLAARTIGFYAKGCLAGGMALPINGVTTGVGNFATFSEIAFDFRVSPSTMLAGIIFALVVGAIGGLFPAGSAARKEILTALREI